MSHWNPSSSGRDPSWTDWAPDDPDPPPYSTPPPSPDPPYSARPPHGGPYYGAPPPHDAPYYGAPPYDEPPPDPYEQPPIWAGLQAPAPPPMWEDPQPPKAYLRQQPSPPGPGRRARTVIALAVTVAVLAAGGGALAFELRSHRAHAGAAGASHPPVSKPQQEQPSPTASPTGSRTAPSPPATPGSAAVAVAPAAARDPAAPQVVNLLTRYFTAINAHDYPAYLRLLDPQMQRIQTALRFSEGFRSTRDSGATLTGLSRAPDGRLAAAVSFTSHQSPADSPDQSACTHWTITLYLRSGGGGYLIGAPPSGYQASHQAC
ncbi:MAG: hypothetical protein ACM3ML_28620 [Micromonosporaceae bacterium]